MSISTPELETARAQYVTVTAVGVPAEEVASARPVIVRNVPSESRSTTAGSSMTSHGQNTNATSEGVTTPKNELAVYPVRVRKSLPASCTVTRSAF